MRNEQELKRSHANGFGGSDAKMFAKIGTKGIESLSTTEKKDNEIKLMEALKKKSVQTFDKDMLAIHNGNGAWINKKRIIEELKELKEKILKCHDLYVIDLLINKIEKL